MLLEKVWTQYLIGCNHSIKLTINEQLIFGQIWLLVLKALFLDRLSLYYNYDLINNKVILYTNKITSLIDKYLSLKLF